MSCPRFRLHHRWYSTFIGGLFLAALRGFLDISGGGPHLVKVLRPDQVPVVADRRAEDGVDPLVVHDETPEGRKDLVGTVDVPLPPLPADVADMVRAGTHRGESVVSYHARPLPVDVDVVGVVEHVRR